MDFQKVVWSLMTVLFFFGAVGSIATVVLFAGELLRTALAKDKTPEHHHTAEEQFQ